MSFEQMFKLKPLTAVEIEQLIEVAKDNSRKRSAIITVLRDTGLRVSEFCRISTPSIIVGASMTQLRVHGKRRPDEKRRPVRHVPLTKRGKKELEWLLDVYGKRQCKECKSAIKIKKKKKDPITYPVLCKCEASYTEQEYLSLHKIVGFHRNTVYQHVRKAAEAAGLLDDGERTISPHCLRHTFGVETAHSKIPPPAIRAAMGHKSLAAAERYQRWDAARVEDSFQEFVDERGGEK